MKKILILLVTFTLLGCTTTTYTRNGVEVSEAEYNDAVQKEELLADELFVW